MQYVCVCMYISVRRLQFRTTQSLKTNHINELLMHLKEKFSNAIRNFDRLISIQITNKLVVVRTKN